MAGPPAAEPPMSAPPTSTGEDHLSVTQVLGFPALSDPDGTQQLPTLLGGTTEPPFWDGPATPDRPAGPASGLRGLTDRLKQLRGDDHTAALVVGAVAGVVILAILVVLVISGFGGHRGSTPAAAPAASAGSTAAAVATGQVSLSATVSPNPSPTPTPSPTPSPTPAGPPSVRAVFSGLCLAPPAGDSNQGTQLVQRACGDPAATFQLVPVNGAPATYNLVNGASRLCVDVDAASADDGAKVIQWSCTGGANQQFRLQDVAGLTGAVQVVAAHSGKCLDVQNASTAQGTLIQQWTCHTPDIEMQQRNQAWQISTG